MGVRSVCGGKRCGNFRSSPYLSAVIGDVTQIQGNLHIPLTDSIWIMQLRGKKQHPVPSYLLGTLEIILLLPF